MKYIYGILAKLPDYCIDSAYRRLNGAFITGSFCSSLADFDSMAEFNIAFKYFHWRIVLTGSGPHNGAVGQRRQVFNRWLPSA